MTLSTPAPAKLYLGPLASGKTTRILSEFRDAVRSGGHPILLVPTATMAQHLRNELAREGLVLRAGQITTLAKFIEPFAPKPVSRASLGLFVKEALDALRPQQFEGVRDLPGFKVAVSELFDELGEWPDASAAVGYEGALAALFAEVEMRLSREGYAFRTPRLRQAAEKIQTNATHVFADGFFSLTEAEITVVEALRRQSNVTVTLPGWSGAGRTRAMLRDCGFKEIEVTRPHECDTAAFAALSTDREVSEIGRRILALNAAGTAFREMAVVLRAQASYAPLLEGTFERLGIPARFYFTARLADDALPRYFAAIIESLLSDWDLAPLLTALRMPVSGLSMDEFDFELRERLPAQGLALLPAHPFINQLRNLDAWRKLKRTPAQWAAEMNVLEQLIAAPQVTGEETRRQIAAWRAIPAALDAFRRAILETAERIKDRKPMPLAEFWAEAWTVIERTSLRVPDLRRNVVHVMDVYEARQWRLPVVFVCGLLEREFPRYHRQDGLLADATRRRFGLPTAMERQEEERFLFDLATSRATSRVVLSYPQFNGKGEDNLPSFFLRGVAIEQLDGRRIRPRPLVERAPRRLPIIYDAGLREYLRTKNSVLSPSGVEQFLQCPFQFFAAKSLRLREHPKKPNERLDPLRQGAILHAVLARFIGGNSSPCGELLDEEFARAIHEFNIPQTFRTEAVRLELLRHLEGFIALPIAWASRTEESFTLKLDESLAIRGRIDRLDVESGRGLVIDYKYSAPEKVRGLLQRSEDGGAVQAGLYMLAAREFFNLEPAGMLYCGLRKRTVWDGWHLPIAGLQDIGENAAPARLRELIDSAVAQTTKVFAQITDGRIVADPADTVKCSYCAFRDICRVESQTAAIGTSQWS